MERRLIVPARLESLEQIGAFIESTLPAMPDRQRRELILAIHELCANIVEHAYAGAMGHITLTISRQRGHLTFLIRDSAPNAYTPPDHSTAYNPCDVRERGWGMLIVQRVIAEVCYRRLPNGNEWRLHTHLNDHAEYRGAVRGKQRLSPEMLSAQITDP
ncbi:MAG: ATP-binding protein [Chloroflexi bacterium]|nr:ATP-binding protein [Chloroflexota bacterium]